MTFIGGKEPGCNSQWSTVLRPQHRCLSALYNICRIQSFLTKDAAQLLVHALVISVWSTATPSWLDSEPLQLNHCSVSRMLQHNLFTIFPNSPMCPPPSWPPLTSCCGLHSIQDDGAGLLSTELHPSASKHWSDLTPQQEHFAHLHQLANWYPHPWEQIKPAQRSRDYSLLWHLSGGTISRPMSGQRNHSPPSTKDSRLICSGLTPHNMTPSWPTPKNVCTCVFISLVHLL